MPAAVSAALILKNHVYSVPWLSPYDGVRESQCLYFDNGFHLLSY